MSSRTFFVFFLFFTIFNIAFLPTVDPDFFWHLKTGKLLLENGFPAGDPFSFTKLGSPWHLHEWLSEVVLFKIFDIAGSGALSLSFATLIVLTFVLVYLRSEEKPYISGIITFMVAYVSSVSWGIRPQVFNMLFASLFIFILEKIRTGKYTNKSYLLLFPLLVLWINLHSGAVLGLFLILIYTGLNLISPNEKSEKLPFSTALGIVLLGLIFMLSSPHGFASLIYPFETLSSPAMKAYIDEWHSPDFHADTGRPFYILLVATVFITMRSRAKPTISELVLILGSLSQALMSYRNIPFFCICVGPYLSRALGDILSTLSPLKDLVRPAPRRDPVQAKVIFGLLFLAYSCFGVLDLEKRVGKSQDEIDKDFPTIAISTLKILNPKRIFNFYSWGGYLIWNDVPVFIDGRADMYGDEFFDKYSEVANVKEDASKILSDYNIDYVLYPTGMPLVTYLKASGTYREVYRDKLATILERVG